MDGGNVVWFVTEDDTIVPYQKVAKRDKDEKERIQLFQKQSRVPQGAQSKYKRIIVNCWFWTSLFKNRVNRHAKDKKRPNDVSLPKPNTASSKLNVNW